MINSQSIESGHYVDMPVINYIFRYPTQQISLVIYCSLHHFIYGFLKENKAITLYTLIQKDENDQINPACFI